MPVVQVLWRLRQKYHLGSEFRSQSGQHSETLSLSLSLSPCHTHSLSLFFLVGLRFELRASLESHLQFIFALVILEIGTHELFLWAGLKL
jgi:hypothetical protein